MKCVLHIGTEKTGSTSLQHWLYDNQEELEEKGICLSKSLGVTHNRLLALYFQSRVDGWCKEHGLEDFDKRRTALAPALQSLRNEVQHARERCHTFLVTSEHLHSRLTERNQVEELFQFLDSLFDSIEVVCYVRNQADLVLSAYSTALRMNWTRTLADFASSVGTEAIYFNHLLSAELWSSVFGRPNVSFRVYEHCLDLPDRVVTDFAENVLDIKNMPGGEKNLNTGLSPFHAAAFRQINIRFPRWPADAWAGKMNRRLKRVISDLPVTTRRRLVVPEPQEILRRFEEKNALFFQEYGDGTNHFSPERWVDRQPEGLFGFEEDPDLDEIIRVLLEQTISEPPRPRGLLFWRTRK